MWNPFRRRPKVWMSIADYYKHYARELKRNPLRFEEEREQARQWAINHRQERHPNQGPAWSPQKGAKLPCENALEGLRDVVREAFMKHPAATEEDFRQCWPGIRQELLKRHTIEKLADDPTNASGRAIMRAATDPEDLNRTSTSTLVRDEDRRGIFIAESDEWLDS